MINHTNCHHEGTSRDRKVCRILSAAKAQAERLGLEVEDRTEGSIRQVLVWEAGRPWYGTHLIITGGASATICILQTTQMRNEGAKAIPSWIATLAH